MKTVNRSFFKKIFLLIDFIIKVIADVRPARDVKFYLAGTHASTRNCRRGLSLISRKRLEFLSAVIVVTRGTVECTNYAKNSRHIKHSQNPKTTIFCW